MAIPLSENFYRDAIKKFETRGKDPVAFTALVVLLNDAERSQSSLDRAKRALSNERNLSAYIDWVRENPPKDFQQLWDNIEDRINKNLQAKQRETIKEKLQELLLAQKQIDGKLDNADKRADSFEGQLQSANEKLAAANAKLQATEGKADDFYEKWSKAEAEITETKTALAGEVAARVETEVKAKKDRRFNYAVGAIGTITGVLGLGYAILDHHIKSDDVPRKSEATVEQKAETDKARQGASPCGLQEKKLAPAAEVDEPKDNIVLLEKTRNGFRGPKGETLFAL